MLRATRRFWFCCRKALQRVFPAAWRTPPSRFPASRAFNQHHFPQLVARNTLWKSGAFQVFQEELPEITAPHYVCRSTNRKPKHPAQGIPDPDELPSSCPSFWPAAGPGWRRARAPGDREEILLGLRLNRLGGRRAACQLRYSFQGGDGISQERSLPKMVSEITCDFNNQLCRDVLQQSPAASYFITEGARRQRNCKLAKKSRNWRGYSHDTQRWTRSTNSGLAAREDIQLRAALFGGSNRCGLLLHCEVQPSATGWISPSGLQSQLNLNVIFLQ